MQTQVSTIWTSATLTADVNSPTFVLQSCDEFEVLSAASGNLVGTLKFQSTDDPVNGPWVDAPSSSTTISGVVPTNVQYIGRQRPILYFRLAFTFVSGSGVITTTQTLKVKA